MKQGKRAIVVGASSGIGLEVTKLLMRQGWTVGVAARRVELLQDLGAAAVECIDVTKDDATESLQRLIRKLGGMDLYFHASRNSRPDNDGHDRRVLPILLWRGSWTGGFQKDDDFSGGS